MFCFAKAAGIVVIATTSSNFKASLLKRLGAYHTIACRETTNWGEHANSLAANQSVVHHVIKVGRITLFSQSLKAIAINGVIPFIGLVGGASKEQSMFLDCLRTLCTGSWAACKLKSLAKGYEQGQLKQMVSHPMLARLSNLHSLSCTDTCLIVRISRRLQSHSPQQSEHCGCVVFLVQ
jgi:NADPH:quinone reductase-like Zn-dependent oxidoreductase